MFLLTGLWHGAAWTFVLWGLYNGVLLVAERLTGVARWRTPRQVILRRAFTFLLVVLGWVLFRAADAARRAHASTDDLVSMNFGPLPAVGQPGAAAANIVALIIGLATVLLPRDLVLGKLMHGRRLDRHSPRHPLRRHRSSLPVAAIAVAAGTFSPFLYFRF